jgi:hypothetical protein
VSGRWAGEGEGHDGWALPRQGAGAASAGGQADIVTARGERTARADGEGRTARADDEAGARRGAGAAARGGRGGEAGARRGRAWRSDRE